MKIMHNPDFSKKMEITKEEAVSTIKQFPWKDEFPRHHYHMLELLIKCKPELFTLPLLNFMGFEKFILDTLSEFKIKDTDYDSHSGGFDLEYTVKNEQINEFLELENQPQVILGFHGSNANRYYYYTLSVELDRNFKFRERIEE